MTITTVLFDADGVVIHPYRFAAYLAREHGLSNEHTKDFFQGVFLDCLVGRADLKTTIAPYLATWGWTDTVDAFLQRWFEEENAPDHRVMGAIEALRRRGIPCYLATNQEHYRVRYMRTTMQFDAHFDGIFASAAVGAMKHDPAFYATVTAQLDQTAETILFWDDSPGNITVARAYGWNAHLYTDFDAFQEVMHTYLPEV
jgi:putative hydrolase of the HAD superfamily